MDSIQLCPRQLISGEIAAGPELNKARSQNLLASVCLIFVLLCVNSFIKARQRQKQGQSPQAPQLASDLASLPRQVPDEDRAIGATGREAEAVRVEGKRADSPAMAGC